MLSQLTSNTPKGLVIHPPEQQGNLVQYLLVSRFILGQQNDCQASQELSLHYWYHRKHVCWQNRSFCTALFLASDYFWNPFLSLCQPSFTILGCHRASLLCLLMSKWQQVCWWLKRSVGSEQHTQGLALAWPDDHVLTNSTSEASLLTGWMVI